MVADVSNFTVFMRLFPGLSGRKKILNSEICKRKTLSYSVYNKSEKAGDKKKIEETNLTAFKVCIA